MNGGEALAFLKKKRAQTTTSSRSTRSPRTRPTTCHETTSREPDQYGGRGSRRQAAAAALAAAPRLAPKPAHQPRRGPRSLPHSRQQQGTRLDAGFNELMAWTPPPRSQARGKKKNTHHGRKHRTQPKPATTEDNSIAQEEQVAIAPPTQPADATEGGVRQPGKPTAKQHSLTGATREDRDRVQQLRLLPRRGR